MDKQLFFQRFARAADLEGEIRPGCSLVEICGNQSVLIEYHQGIICYSKDNITVKSKSGWIDIKGRCLSLSQMTKEQLVITGCIHSVELSGRR